MRTRGEGGTVGCGCRHSNKTGAFGASPEVFHSGRGSGRGACCRGIDPGDGGVVQASAMHKRRCCPILALVGLNRCQAFSAGASQAVWRWFPPAAGTHDAPTSTTCHTRTGRRWWPTPGRGALPSRRPGHFDTAVAGERRADHEKNEHDEDHVQHRRDVDAGLVCVCVPFPHVSAGLPARFQRSWSCSP